MLGTMKADWKTRREHTEERGGEEDQIHTHELEDAFKCISVRVCVFTDDDRENDTNAKENTESIQTLLY